MSASTKQSWWFRQPGELVGARGGGLLSGLFGLGLGVLLLTAAAGCGLQALLARDGFTAWLWVVGAGLLGLTGLPVARWGEGAFGGGFWDGNNPSTTRMALGARLAMAASLLVGIGLELLQIVKASDSPDPVVYVYDHGWEVAWVAGMLAAMALIPALLVGVSMSGRLLRSDGAPSRRVVIGWASVTALCVVAGVAMPAHEWITEGSVDTLLLNGRWVLWTLVLSALAGLMAASARKQLAIWDGADRWRDATLTPDLRLIFPDGSGSRAASAYFSGYSGPVVVMPTAAAAGAVFRGDGAPADGWVVPGTRAALEEAVRCSRAVAAVTVAAVALVATAPLAVWLVSLVG